MGEVLLDFCCIGIVESTGNIPLYVKEMLGTGAVTQVMQD
jgi:hypothetical protein